MVTGWQKLGGSWYYLRENGAMATGWVMEKDAETGKPYWYWLDEESGRLLTEDWKEIDGVWYYFDEDGRMAEQ